MSEIFQIPDTCPVCSGPTSIEGDFLYCRSQSCPAKLSSAIKVWVNRLGLLQWGDALIDRLCDPKNPKIQNVADLYRLSVEDISSCCSGVKVAKKCHEILHANKSVAIELILASLNIPNLGLTTATDIVCNGYDTVEKILNLTYDQLIAVNNVGPITAQSIVDGLREKAPILIDLKSVLNIKTVSDGPLKGKFVVITGELSKPRKATEKLIMDAGGYPKGSVTKETSFLVTNDPTTGSGKLKNAAKYGVQIISEAKLYAMINIP